MEWQAYFELEDKERNDREDERAIGIVKGVMHAFCGEGELDLSELFPRYRFKEEEDNTTDTSVKSSEHNIAMALGVRS